MCEGHAELDFGEYKIDKARIAIRPRSVDRGNAVGSRDAIGQPYDRDALLRARNGRRISDTRDRTSWNVVRIPALDVVSFEEHGAIHQIHQPLE